MPSEQQWRLIYTLTYSARGTRKAAVVPIEIVAEWARIEIVFLTFPKPEWYLAGWLSQVYSIKGKPYTLRSVEVPLMPSVHKMANTSYYKLRFKPVVYLPSCMVKIYRSI